jgi:hypothetical protein
MIDETKTPLIRKLKNAEDVWETLKEYHQRSTLSSNKVCHLKKLCRVKLKAGVSMEADLFYTKEIFEKLLVMGREIREDFQVALILFSLPDSYDVLVTLEARPEKDLTVTDSYLWGLKLIIFCMTAKVTKLVEGFCSSRKSHQSN